MGTDLAETKASIGEISEDTANNAVLQYASLQNALIQGIVAETKGDTTNFQTATIEGKAYPVEVNGKMSVGKKLVFNTEAEAKAWLNKQGLSKEIV